MNYLPESKPVKTCCMSYWPKSKSVGTCCINHLSESVGEHSADYSSKSKSVDEYPINYSPESGTIEDNTINYLPESEIVDGYFVGLPVEAEAVDEYGMDYSSSNLPGPGSVDECCIDYSPGSLSNPVSVGKCCIDCPPDRLPESELVMIPGGTLITRTPEEGRALAMLIARHTVHNIQPNPTILACGRRVYSVDPDSLIAASQVVATEFQTIAAANDYWRKPTCYWEQHPYL